jgi:hypothetical protein
MKRRIRLFPLLLVRGGDRIKYARAVVVELERRIAASETRAKERAAANLAKGREGER